MAYLIFVAWPSDCEECYFNISTKRAECANCTTGLGVTDDDKTCARKCEIKGCTEKLFFGRWPVQLTLPWQYCHSSFF